MNADGSTNNMCQYYWYCRDSLMNSLWYLYPAMLVWTYISGILVYYISMHGFGHIVNSDGHVNNYWNVGATIILTDVMAVHVIIFSQTKNYTVFNGGFYAFSFAMWFVNISLNNISDWDVFYENQWSIMLGSPLFWFVLIIQCTVVSFPWIVDKILKDVILHPEFTKIKGQ